MPGTFHHVLTSLIASSYCACAARATRRSARASLRMGGILVVELHSCRVAEEGPAYATVQLCNPATKLTPMNRICIFCGSFSGVRAEYANAARATAAALVRRGVILVYGGGRVGLMGILADEGLRLGGRAIGVIPHALREREVGHAGLSEMHIVDTMHQRKAKMADLADAFIALPGGLGTIEEIFEIWTWAQLGMHNKPCGLLCIPSCAQ